MADAYWRAIDKIGSIPLFDPNFLDLFIDHGLEVALPNLIQRYDLNDEEAEAIRQTFANAPVWSFTKNQRAACADPHVR